MQILVIEDDPAVQTLIKAILEKQNHDVAITGTVASAKEEADKGNSDTVILDLGLPDGDGFELCQDFREQGISAPILILSGESDTDVKVKCLNAGADDYVTKPFEGSELIARLNAIARRSSSDNGSSIVTGGELIVNKINRTCAIDGNVVQLTNNELDLLVYLMEREGTIISPYKLQEDIWDINHHTPSNFINVYISYLRKKIRKHSEHKYIKTVRSEGFVFTDPMK